MGIGSRPPWRGFTAGTISLVSAALLAALVMLAVTPAPAAPARPAQAVILELVAAPAAISPGAIGDYLFKITNGSADDRTFGLILASTGGLVFTFPVGTQVRVAPGSSAEFTLRALVPTGAALGSSFVQTVIATSSSPTGLQLSTLFTITVGGASLDPTPTPYALPILLDVISAPAPILPGAIGDFRLRITNNSADDRTFSLSMLTTGGITSAFPAGTQMTVAAGHSAEFTIQVLVPPDVLPGRTFIQTLYAFSASPTRLQVSNFFMVSVGGPTPYALNLPLVHGDSSASQATPTRTPFPTMTPYVPITPTPASVKINDVICRDPQYPADSEFIELRNNGSALVDLTGWSISNTSRGNTAYIFPTYTLPAGPDTYVAVYSGIGTNKPNFGELWWGRADQLWFVGDKAELRDATGKLIDSYVVLASSCFF